MEAANIQSVPASQRGKVIPTIVLAFAADPLVRWLWPDAGAYLGAMPELTVAFAGGAFDHGSAFCNADYSAAALWLPPQISPDSETLGALVQRTVAPETLAEMAGVSEQMAEHHPDEPHWYLPLIGVDPARQGRGQGAALMKHALRRFDADGAVAYLESTNPRNISLYERHGFEAVGRIQAGSSPVIVPMLRQPS
ncbi:MAG: GNAT family N-acetyltransferase [Pseudomonadales bacterium]